MMPIQLLFKGEILGVFLRYLAKGEIIFINKFNTSKIKFALSYEREQHPDTCNMRVLPTPLTTEYVNRTDKKHNRLFPWFEYPDLNSLHLFSK
jgi:hypothetical protein